MAVLFIADLYFGHHVFFSNWLKKKCTQLISGPKYSLEIQNSFLRCLLLKLSEGVKVSLHKSYVLMFEWLTMMVKNHHKRHSQNVIFNVTFMTSMISRYTISTQSISSFVMANNHRPQGCHLRLTSVANNPGNEVSRVIGRCNTMPKHAQFLTSYRYLFFSEIMFSDQKSGFSSILSKTMWYIDDIDFPFLRYLIINREQLH
jgi:hypothetical protein